MTLCLVSYIASIRLSEHEHNVVRTLTKCRGSRVKHSSKLVTCRLGCQLGHVHFFNNMFTLSCETTNCVIFDVSHDVSSVF